MELKKELINIVKEIQYKNHSLLEMVFQQKNLQVNDALICDILALPDFKKNPKLSLQLIEAMLENGVYNRLIQDELSRLVTEGSILSLAQIDEKFETITDSILSQHYNFSADLLYGYINILEELYAKGIDVRKSLVALLRVMDDNNPTRRYDADVIRIKMALAAYGANKYNCKERLDFLDHYAMYIKCNRLNNLKATMHYYYAVFKERFSNCVSSVYNKDIHNSYWHLEKAKKRMFALAEFVSDYY